jgi:hypothetical protein
MSILLLSIIGLIICYAAIWHDQPSSKRPEREL